MFIISIQDQFPIGKVIHELKFEVGTEKMTVSDLIRKRVHEEVMLYNLSQPGYFQGLVQPSDIEVTLNGNKLRQKRNLDWEVQAGIALQAFQQNGFFILIDNCQVNDLDELIEIKEDTQIAFIKLIPLIGG